MIETLDQATQALRATMEAVRIVNDPELNKIAQGRVNRLNKDLKRIEEESHLETKHKRNLMLGYMLVAIHDIGNLGENVS